MLREMRLRQANGFLSKKTCISPSNCGLQEKTTEKPAVESVVFKVTVLLYNLSFT